LGAAQRVLAGTHIANAPESSRSLSNDIFSSRRLGKLTIASRDMLARAVFTCRKNLWRSRQ